MPLLRRTALIAVAPLLAVSLVACSGESAGDEIDAEDFAKRISEAADETSSARVQMELISSGLVTTSDGHVDYSGDEPAITMKMHAPAIGNQAIESTLLEGTMYLSFPNEKRPESIWYKIDLEDPDNPLGDIMGGMENLDPRSTIDSFGKGLQKVVYESEESVEGIETKHYKVTGETSSVTGGAGKDGAGKGGAGKGETGTDAPGQADLPETLTYDVWLDDEDRLIQMEADLDEQGSMKLTMTEWGEKTSIQAPPKDQVRDYPVGAGKPKR